MQLVQRQVQRGRCFDREDVASWLVWSLDCRGLKLMLDAEAEVDAGDLESRQAVGRGGQIVLMYFRRAKANLTSKRAAGPSTSYQGRPSRRAMRGRGRARISGTGGRYERHQARGYVATG